MFNITELLKNEISVWERLKNCGKPVVLYGMGDGADKVLAAFDRYGIKASAVIASDDFVRGQKFHDFTVKKLSDVETEFGNIIIALCFASQLPDVIEHITKISENTKHLFPLFLFLETNFLTIILLPKIKSKLKVHTVCSPMAFQKRFTKTF
mgnify:FL=1